MGLAVVVVPVLKAELTSSTVLEAVLAVLAFAVASACFALAASIAALASAILSSGFEVVVDDPVVVNVDVSPVVGDPGGGVVLASSASHSSSMVASPEVTNLKQYSVFSGSSCLKSQCEDWSGLI